MFKRIGGIVLLMICVIVLAACAAPGVTPAPAPAAEEPAPAEAQSPVEEPAVAATDVPVEEDALTETLICAKMAEKFRKFRDLDSETGDKIKKELNDQGVPSHLLDRWKLQNEVVLLGHTGAITRFVDYVRTVTPTLTLEQLGGKGGTYSDATNTEWHLQVYGVYDNSGDPTNLSALKRVLDLARERTGEDKIYADPNYPIQTMDGVKLGGSTWHIGESPYGGNVTVQQDEVAHAFIDQWALGEAVSSSVGIDLAASSIFTGTGTHIWVFDTSPFDNEQDLVTYVDILSSVTTTTGLATGKNLPCNSSDHGLFVASLAKQVAPDSTVHLYHVLDGYGTGKLGDLELAITSVAQEWIVATGSDKVLLNMSLGVITSTTPITITGMLEGLPEALRQARERGIVIVAAAGNESANLAPPFPLEYPASDPGVIGVAATNMSGNAACYSNWGQQSQRWVAAPGGDGIPSPATASNYPDPTVCKPRAGDCPGANGTCEFGVVGMVFRAPGYAYWSGTSFATPLVSGLAARVLDAKSLTGGEEVAESVWETIKCGAGGNPGGLINVPLTEQCIADELNP